MYLYTPCRTKWLVSSTRSPLGFPVARKGIDFVLGHALYMKAIHGGKSKNDKLDAEKIARLLRGGTLAQAYVYPQEKRATRDLLRRRSYLVRMRADLLGHVQLTRH